MLGVRKKRWGVLFVCTNNICRSPMADGVLRTIARDAGLLPRLLISSAGTHPNCIGQAVDVRARVVAERRGYVIPRNRARMVSAHDFARYRWILAMDAYNLKTLAERRPSRFAGRLCLLGGLDSSRQARDVADPYFGTLAGFERVLDQIEGYCRLLLRQLAPLLDDEAHAAQPSPAPPAGDVQD